jgi:hypothetical protein
MTFRRILEAGDTSRSQSVDLEIWNLEKIIPIATTACKFDTRIW